ncbi:MAG: SLOG family protein [Clostridia bacterium]|nr:SLOG family protein [Clostridia bacterium]
MKTLTCCFTGHRPQKFHFGVDEQHRDCVRLKRVLEAQIKAMIDQGITTFYSGMALGTDMWCAQIVQAFQENMPERDIRLIAVVPFEGQADRWSHDFRARYCSILAKATEVVTLNARYNMACMQQRNRHMVDRASHVIAVYSGAPGGARYTVEYARGKNRTLVIIDPGSGSATIQPPV